MVLAPVRTGFQAEFASPVALCCLQAAGVSRFETPASFVLCRARKFKDTDFYFIFLCV